MALKSGSSTTCTTDKKMAMITKYAGITTEVSEEIRYLHRVKKYTAEKLMSTFPQYSKSYIYRHMVKVRADLKEQTKIRKKKENITKNTCKNVCTLIKPNTYKNVPIETSMHMQFCMKK